MRRLAKNLVHAALVISTVCIVDISLFPVNKDGFIVQEKFIAVSPKDNPDENDSEFWSKFKKSVMPEEDDKGKIPNYEKNPPPPANEPPHESK